MLLIGKVAVITGGTRGIGRGIAEAFLANGASVMLNSRTAEKGAQALAELNVGDRAGTLALRSRRLNRVDEGQRDQYGDE